MVVLEVTVENTRVRQKDTLESQPMVTGDLRTHADKEHRQDGG